MVSVIDSSDRRSRMIFVKRARMSWSVMLFGCPSDMGWPVFVIGQVQVLPCRAVGRHGLFHASETETRAEMPSDSVFLRRNIVATKRAQPTVTGDPRRNMRRLTV